MAALIGTWTLDKSDNYDAFLKAAGMGSMKRGFAVKLGGSITVTQLSPSKFEFTVVNGPKTKTRQVEFGSEFEEDGIEGGKIKGSWVQEGDKLIGTFKNDKGKEFKFTREIKDRNLVQTMEHAGVSATRTYKKK